MKQADPWLALSTEKGTIAFACQGAVFSVASAEPDILFLLISAGGLMAPGSVATTHQHNGGICCAQNKGREERAAARAAAEEQRRQRECAKRAAEVGGTYQQYTIARLTACGAGPPVVNARDPTHQPFGHSAPWQLLDMLTVAGHPLYSLYCSA